ncbi:MAG: FAD-dependent oxidoreductase [Ectothiorhodospiraceae bacterium]|nr:FAD-dependent oxidoreductase [Ectothiorhodospiraceae bacterium]
MNANSQPPLAGFAFTDLLEHQGLEQLDRRFLQWLDARDGELAQRVQAYRRQALPSTSGELSGFLLALAPQLEHWLEELFGVGGELAAIRQQALDEQVVWRFKREWVQKAARRQREPVEHGWAELEAWLDDQLQQAGLNGDDREYAVAHYAETLRHQDADHPEVVRLVAWCRLALHEPGGRSAVAGWSSFRLPAKVDHANLVPMQPASGPRDVSLHAEPSRWRSRDGFALTDHRMHRRDVQSEVDYCVYCHDHDGDFCSRGFPEKKKQPELGFKLDPLGVTLVGCPLEEKISEMHVLKRDGRIIAALAMAMVDNPMVPATGHRICNDCMKSCIYQKQDPVNIPQVETAVLSEVLGLPWGVEIYDLLSRWNPLRREQYLMQPYNGRNVLVAGMGPAGFTMAHYLTMAGCGVLGIEGLKVAPLPVHMLRRPIRDWSELEEPLDERVLLGFGGVAEYGITVRWDKNFLKLIYLSLLRRPTFQIKGGVRLGGTLTLEDAWELGFDHACLATGAGYPRVIPIGNSLARGMRQANDFLMALQLTGAGKETSIANLQVRLPAVVIGGGLTGVDTATEVQAYYIKQVEKTLKRYRRLCEHQGEQSVRAGLSPEDLETLDEFLDHGRAVEEEREQAVTEGRDVDFIPLLHAWGGVTIAYRKGMNASPAYIRNHEELIKATEEGLFYAEGLDPIHAVLDANDHVEALILRRMESREGRWFATNQEVRLPARSIFVAAGTGPNTIYQHEHPAGFEMERDHYLPHVEHENGLQPVQVAEHVKASEVGPFTSYQHEGRTVTFLGDTHPVFNGSVVKAIASSKRSYPGVLKALRHLPKRTEQQENYTAFRERMDTLFDARVVEVNRDNPAVVEIWVRAPMAARKFRPGQFFRFQTYAALSRVVEGTRLQVPLMTVSGTGLRDDQIRLMVLQWGAAPRIAGRLQPGDPVVLMGPTGEPAHIPSGETVLVVAGRWGAAVMHDIGTELRAAGNRVLYLAAFGKASDVDHQDELEAGADQIIWATAADDTIAARRPQDVSLQATDMVEVLSRYHRGDLGPAEGGLSLAEVSRIMVMGGTGLLRGFQQALAGELGSCFPPHVKAVGTVGSPMQCMLKGVCSQCLQWQIDPETGKRTRAVFSCAEQDQPLAWIDLDNLAARQQQNRLADALTGRWIDYVLQQEAEPAAR